MLRSDRALAACLTISGAAGLMYEVLWLRQFALVMGNTVYALSAVLTAFLGGLALGALLAGRWTQRRGASLRLYAGIELSIAASAVVMPWLIRALGPVFGVAYRALGDAFVTYNLVQFALCAVLLVVPTSFMGATLPVVTAVLLRKQREIAVDVGRLYALNSIGGVLGAGLAGFWLLPQLGMRGTGFVAVGINVAVAAAVILLAWRQMDPLLAGTVDFRLGNRSLPLKKGGQEGFSNGSFRQIPLDPPFSKGEVDADSAGVRLSTLPAKEGTRGRLSDVTSQTSPDPSLVRRGTLAEPFMGRESEPGHPGEDSRAESLESPLKPAPWPAPPASLLMCLYGLSGFAALALEVGWARIVGLAIGSTTYGATIILVTYICGLAAGSFFAPRVRLLGRHPVPVIVGLNATIALWSLVSLSYLGALPLRVAQLVGGGGGLSFVSLMTGEMALVFATIVVPTLAMGGMFPLVTQLLQQRVGAPGRAVGSTYAANTLGNIVGSFVAGFALVPAIGMRATIVVSALLSGIVGFGYLLPAIALRRWSAALSAAVLAAGLGSAILWAPAWDREVVTSAPYLYGSLIFRGHGQGTEAIKDAIRKKFGELVDYREGATSVVAVKRLRDTLLLQVGGTGLSEALSYASTQNFIAHAPLLLHGTAKHVLVVGLGSGTTLGSVLTYPIEHADCVEISPEVRDVARQYFSEYTGHPLDDPRVHLIIGDGRNHLQHSQAFYDVIVSQPSHPWVSGAASLFTREYFTELRDHLAPGGVACAWFAPYNEDAKRSVLRAWSDVFPDAYVFESIGLVLVGRRDRGLLSAANVARGMARSEVRRDLARLSISEPADLFGALVLGPQALARSVAGAPLNTDDNAYVEFKGLRDAHQYDPLQVLAGFAGDREDPTRLVDATLSSPEESAAFTRRLAALFERHTLILKAKAVESKEGRTPLWRALLQTAVALDPKDPQRSVDDSRDEAAGVPTLAKAYTNLGAAYEQKGLLDDARAALQRALTIAPDLSEAHYDLANVSYKSGRVDDAIASYEAALRFNPNLVLAHYNLGVMYYQRQDFEHAIDHIDRAAAAGFSVPPRLLEALKPHRK